MRHRLATRSAPWRGALRSVCVTLALALCAGCTGEPDLLAEHLRRGDEALAAGRYIEAMAAYGHAHELAPTSSRVQRAQMWARVHLMADSPDQVGAEALEGIAYEARLLLATDKLEPARQAVCLAAMGNVLARRGNEEGARAKLDEAVKVDPASAIAHAALGVLLGARRDQAAAAKLELERALQLSPESVPALVGLAQIQLADGDLDGAAARLEAALRLRDDTSVRALLGRTRLQQGKHAEAAALLERATSADPKSADAWSGLGQALLGQGRPDEAERALRTAMSLRSDEPTAIALGFALSRLRKHEQALGVFGQILAQNATAAPALFGAAVASEDLGRGEQALDFYRRVLALPAEGPQKALVVDLQKEARGRAAALAAPPPSASATPSATTEPGAGRPPK